MTGNGVMKTRKNIFAFVLLIAFSLLACIVAFASRGGDIRAMNVFKNFVYNLPVCLLVGYLDYKIIVYTQRWHKTFGVWKVLVDILVSSVLLGVLSLAYIIIGTYLYGEELHLFHRLILSAFCNSMIMLVAEIFYYNQQYLENRARLAEAEKEKAQYQFEALKNQINPHFLFNSLNVLSSLAYQDATKANLFAKKLSSVYRYLLATQEVMKVPLQDELDFVEAYVYLERIRFGDTLHVNLLCDAAATGRFIVPASIQMLVENALKHNINTKESPLVVDVRVEKECVTVANNLQLRSSVSRNRVGLRNLDRQYRIYGKHIEVCKTATKFAVMLPLLT